MSPDVLELASSLSFVAEVEGRFGEDPSAVDPSWTTLLGPGAAGMLAELPRPAAAVATLPAGAVRPGKVTLAPTTQSPSTWPLVNAYRSRGHLLAHLDPLGLVEAHALAELDPETWGLTLTGTRALSPTGVHGLASATIGQLREVLASVYCQSIGLEFMHISAPARRTWLAERMETRHQRRPDPVGRKRMLEILVGAEGFERFCHVKYPGTKRFSLEGSEALVPMLDLVLAHGARLGAVETVIGMAHRGRLTTLEMIMQRAARDIFAEFEDIEPEASLGGGDVKYHLGYSCDRALPGGAPMHVSLSFNPSHLEAVDPVVLGRVRAKQQRISDGGHQRVMGVLVHGDAAFAGQGLVSEILNLTNLPGYRTGGTVHLIVNNQVGFTASPAEQRSTPYCTDVAKMIECPIWHVNGDDLDAVAEVVEMALEYRARFGSDVVIDMYCYRKYGHNEMDEPAFTQPIMVERISQRASVVDLYGRRLISEGVVTPAELAQMVAGRLRHLERELAAAKSTTQRPRTAAMAGAWQGYQGGVHPQPQDAATAVSAETLARLTHRLTSVPPGFSVHPKIVRLLQQRQQMGNGQRPIDWGMAELLAYASLLGEGRDVRVSGQDSSRGTFSHRHAILTDVHTGAEHLALSELGAGQGHCSIYDSPLSEAGVLGFEFGYSLDYPEALVAWEAQFGDFANGAQVIIDQFLMSSEDKWHRLSGLVLLLPHGYEGQGPEHSSARLERFLQSCAEHNVQVAQPTTPAQMFHLLRRQVLRVLRKPLVVMTPKSLLRLPAAVSTVAEFDRGTFRRVIPDETLSEFDPRRVRRALCCSGKIYYELLEERRKRGIGDVAIIRVEELYPWWSELMFEAIAPYPALREVCWVQDEPANMGAGQFIMARLGEVAAARGCKVQLVARHESASPATGSHKAHAMEQAQIMNASFAP
jgi:2-oxoglutarate dehydrogenase E1 component